MNTPSPQTRLFFRTQPADLPARFLLLAWLWIMHSGVLAQQSALRIIADPLFLKPLPELQRTITHQADSMWLEIPHDGQLVVIGSKEIASRVFSPAAASVLDSISFWKEEIVAIEYCPDCLSGCGASPFEEHHCHRMACHYKVFYYLREKLRDSDK